MRVVSKAGNLKGVKSPTVSIRNRNLLIVACVLLMMAISGLFALSFAGVYRQCFVAMFIVGVLVIMVIMIALYFEYANPTN